MIIKDDFELTEYNSYRIEAFCSKAIFPELEDELLLFFKENIAVPKIILGNGNNIIFSKQKYEELFVIFNGTFDAIEVYKDEIIALAGATMLQLSTIALQNSLSGFEIFYDIPSSVGGAIVMNAGANGEEISALLKRVRYLDLEDMEIKEITKQDINFEYRNSFFQKFKDKIILKAWFHLKQGNPFIIKAKMETIKQNRWAKQPREFPSCGSVFKRPENHYVGAMVEELNLKGLTIGGAQISEKHGGFIINRNNATGEDILKIIKIIQEKVKESFKLDLEIEPKII